VSAASTKGEAVEHQGNCDDRFAAVADAFERNFAERGEVGASVSVTVAGETVVDLWGGHADAERITSWEKDTISVVLSCTKGATALCAHLLSSAGDLDFDEPVSTYWPEFAANGKERVLVRHLLNHQSGVIGLRELIPQGKFYDWDWMVERLAAEEPFWAPGTRHGYHGNTFGFLVGEVVRRVTGRPINEFFKAEVADPLGLDFHMGALPESEHGRVALLLPPPMPAPGEPVSKFVMDLITDPTSMAFAVAGNTGGYLFPGEWDSPAALSAVLPSTSGVTNARSLAAMYRAIVHDRQIGRFSVTAEDLAHMNYVESAGSEDAVISSPGRWTAGFMKSGRTARGVEPAVSVLLSEAAFGHTGMGGSIAFADPGADMSFAYTMNQMAADMGMGPTGQSLIDATYESLGYRQSRYGVWVR